MSRKPRERSDSESAPQCQRVVFNLESPCNSLCTNREGTLLAAAGRKVFKILKLGSEQFDVAYNLRDLPHKQLNLNYSSNDVQWNPRDESQLATAPTNSSVVIWDINKRTKSKLAHVFEGFHQRAVNKLSFHPREPNCLLSGSQDSSMCIFDTRQRTVVATYKAPDSVRDVKFAKLPANDNYFAACFDNGMLGIWDRRYGENAIKQCSVHSGPAYCCDWHPEQEHWIMSAGRDKMIKVLDIQQARPKDLSTVPALFSVARVKWRPSHKYHIASCSHFLDNMVAIWDFRRPFIPFASFTEHTDDVTDFLWLNDQVLLSCSKDGKLIQQLFSEAERPAERATPVGLSFRPDGNLAQACSDFLAHRSKTTHHSSQYGSSRQPISFRKADADPYQHSFLLHTSSLKEYASKEAAETASFIACANSYKLHGLPVHELCDYNYTLAHSLGREDVAQTWMLLKLLYCGSDPECSWLGLIQTRVLSRHTSSSRLSTTQQPTVGPNGVVEPQTLGSATKETAAEGGKGAAARDPTLSTDSAQEESGDEAEENNAADVSADLDFFEYDDKDSDVAPPQNLVQQTQSEWGELPPEPFQLRHDIVQRPPSPDHDDASAISTSQSAVETGSSVKQHPLEVLMQSRQSSVTRPHWNFSPVVSKMLKFYAEQGDVQTSVSVLLVLGDQGKELVDDKTIEQWFSSYIDLLIRHQLWCVASLVIKLCPLSEIREMSQQSTVYHVGCGSCNKLMEKNGWQCHRCEKIASLCSICHGTVRGLCVWCQVCGHGGHLQHIQEWHRNNTQCPSGCGHDCVNSVVST